MAETAGKSASDLFSLFFWPVSFSCFPMGTRVEIWSAFSRSAPFTTSCRHFGLRFSVKRCSLFSFWHLRIRQFCASVFFDTFERHQFVGLSWYGVMVSRALRGGLSGTSEHRLSASGPWFWHGGKTENLSVYERNSMRNDRLHSIDFTYDKNVKKRR